MTSERMFDDAPSYDKATFPPPRPFQDTAHQALRQGVKDGHRCQVLMAPTGGGKCLGYDTPVLMADGFVKPVQDIRTGDALMGPDGKPRNVLSVASGGDNTAGRQAAQAGSKRHHGRGI